MRKGTRACVVLCLNRFDGIIYSEEYASIHRMFVHDARQVRAVRLMDDVELIETPAFKSNPDAEEIRERLTMRDYRQPIRFVCVNNVHYPVTTYHLDVHRVNDAFTIAMVLRLAYGGEARLSAKVAVVSNGRDTVWLAGAVVEEAEL